jgi:hypothetical protein
MRGNLDWWSSSGGIAGRWPGTRAPGARDGTCAAERKAITTTASLHWVTLCTGKQPEIDKAPDGYIISAVVVVIRREYWSIGITSDFKNSLLFSLFSGNLKTAGLWMIGGESGSMSYDNRVDAAIFPESEVDPGLFNALN